MSQAFRFLKSVAVKTLWFTPVVVTANDLLAGPASVHGRSMQPTFNPTGSASSDLVLVDRLSIRLYRYSRGDVVLFRSPACPDTILIKRLLALEGDWVALPERVDIEKIPQVCKAFKNPTENALRMMIWTMDHMHSKQQEACQCRAIAGWRVTIQS